MARLLKDHLQDLLELHLQEARQFPVDLTGSGRALQIINFTSYRDEKDRNKGMSGAVSDQFTWISCEFSAKCCNEFEKQYERRLSEVRGGLIIPQRWGLNVVSAGNEEVKAIIQIDSLRFIESERETKFGRPLDFNSQIGARNILSDPKRRSIYLPHLEEEGYSSQQETSRFETQPLSTEVHFKRKRLWKDVYPGWTEIKKAKYKETQIPPAQQAFLDSGAAWVTPRNIREYDGAATEVDEQVYKGVIRDSQDHPPLSSPEIGSPGKSLHKSQFYTQAPPMMDESLYKKTQSRSRREEAESREEAEASEEKEYEWELTPSPERVSHKDKKEENPVESTDSNVPGRKDLSPRLRNEDELPASQQLEDEHPITSAQAAQTATWKSLEEVIPDDEISATMKVGTAELLTQASAPREDTAGEDGYKEEADEKAEDKRQFEDMEEVEETGNATIQTTERELEDLEVDVSAALLMSLRMNTGRFSGVHSQPIPTLTGTEDVTSIKYPPSSTSSILMASGRSPSLEAPGPGQRPRYQLSSIRSSQNPPPKSRIDSSFVPPPPTSLPYQPASPEATPDFRISPSKATQIPVASAQIQVQETPLSNRSLLQPITFTDPVTRISATAPSDSSPEKRPAEEGQRRGHRRERHIGPIIPKFSRRERRSKFYPEAMIQEDRKEFFVALKGKAPAKPEKEIVQEAIEVEMLDEAEAEIQPEEPLSSKFLGQTSPQPASQTSPQPASQLVAEESPLTEEAAQTRWGRFADHWRRFARFAT